MGNSSSRARRLTVTAEILKFDDGEVKLKAYGTVGGRIILSARLTLACYNLADSDPQHEATDAATRRGFAEPMGLVVPAASGKLRRGNDFVIADEQSIIHDAI